LLGSHDFCDLENKKTLDVGCGNGSWLRNFVQWGARPDNCYGIDLLEDRISEARQISPNMHFALANAEKLDFPDGRFDIVLLATCLTSIFDRDMKKHIAREAKRVLNDAGMILWYDFRYNNPWNPDVKGIKKKEIVELFGDCEYDFKSVTLAPPIARCVCACHPSLYSFFNIFPFLRTHVLCWITK
jgi:ubiquinone/menaquinone biosynthesis C-methylase UbiE